MAGRIEAAKLREWFLKQERRLPASPHCTAQSKNDSKYDGKESSHCLIQKSGSQKSESQTLPLHPGRALRKWKNTVVKNPAVGKRLRRYIDLPICRSARIGSGIE
jgi:hypothetical protein